MITSQPAARPTKVGFVFPNDPNPIFVERMWALEESNQFDVYAIYWHRSSDLSYPFSIEPLPQDRFTGVHLPDPCSSVVRRAWLTLVFAWRIRRWVKEHGFQVLHVVYPNMLIAAYLGTLRRDIEIVYDIWDVDYGRTMPWWHRIAYRILLSKTHQVYTTSEVFEETFITPNRILRPGSQVTHISNAPYDMQGDGVVRRRTRVSFPRAAGPLIIGCIGNLRVPKQLQMLFDAVNEVRSTGRDVRVRLSGAGSRKQMVSRAAAESDAIEYTGPFDFQRDGESLYAALDVVFAVYPLEIYNYRVHVARRLHDSVRAGTPIIVASESHMGDIVTSKGIGWAVGHESKEGLVKLLTELHDNRYLVVQAAKNAAEKAHEHSFSSHRDTYIGTYVALLGKLAS